jgi:Ca2+-binding RTX toxin-like protein
MVNVVGAPGDDNMSGTNGDDDLRGVDGNDIIRDTLGHNYIDGGRGADTFVFGRNSGGGIHVDLSLGGYQDVGGAQFSFNSIEGI